MKKLARAAEAVTRFSASQEPPRLPRDLDELLMPPDGQEPYLEADDLLDQWGRRIVMEREDRCRDGERVVTLISMSEDGVRDGLDQTFLTVGASGFDPTCPVVCRCGEGYTPWQPTARRLEAVCEAIVRFSAAQTPQRPPTSLQELVEPPTGQSPYLPAELLRDQWGRAWLYGEKDGCTERFKHLYVESGGEDGKDAAMGHIVIPILVRVETEECASRLKPRP